MRAGGATFPGTLEPGRPIFLAGPTAVGKSAVALELADRLQGEIISVDSMQVYRGMDIGTAKANPSEQKRVRHHLIDVLDLTETFDAGHFVRLAKEAARDIEMRGRTPIFCGGTGLYFKAYLAGLGDAPPANPSLRAELEGTPLESLLAELERSDPVTFAKIDRRNPRRVVRAMEVIRLTGRPFSAQQSNWGGSSGGTERAFCLSRPPGELAERIRARVDEMFRNGLVAETEFLLKNGLGGNAAAMQALGYRQVVEHLRGERSLAETVELVKIRTRQFAKRQLTWFRRQLRFTWLAFQHGHGV